MKSSTQGRIAVFTLMISMLMIAALLACDGGAMCGCGPVDDPTLVTTQSGELRGVQEGDMVAFRRIPYAAPPVGDLRWKAPQDPANWSGERDASAFGNTCPQVESPFGAGSLSEDCLFLNVNTPGIGGSYPVMVWIHGGAFIAGSGQEAGYDPTRLVQQGVVIVTLNYRLGALGFLPLAALTDESGESGNYGLMDQQKALRWVRDNIAAFGGNPGNVTIFGESAGGHSVYTHIVTPSSKGLFHKGIAESGAFSPTQPTMEEAYALYGIPFKKRAGITATDPAEIRALMRSMSVEEVLTAQAGDWYLPVTGGYLPQSIFDAVTKGEFNEVPVISGSNLNEGRLFTALDMAQGINYDTEGEFKAALTTLLAQDPRGLDVDAVAAEYLSKQGATDPNRFRLAYSKVFTDFMFASTNFYLWDQLAMKSNVYAYWFADISAPNPFDSPLLPMQATHMDEIQYVFGTIAENGGTEAQIALSNQIIGFWTRFARMGAPAVYRWNAFRSGGIFSPVKKLDTPLSNTTAMEFITANNCLFWAEPPIAAEKIMDQK